MKHLIGAIVASLLIALYYIYFSIAEDVDASSLGTLGDFIGGNINPVLTFISTILLIETLSLQRKATVAAEKSADEAKATFAEQSLLIQTQIFESSFFQIMSLCLEEYKSIKIDTSVSTYKSSAAFKFIEEAFMARKLAGEEPSEIIDDLELTYGDLIFSIVKSFGAMFSFVIDSAPAERRDQYIKLSSKLAPMPVICFICISKLHTDWPLLKPFDEVGFFDKKGIRNLMDGYS